MATRRGPGEYIMAHRVGTKAAYQSVSSDARLRCIFEDDGDTGYLYALDHSDGSAQPIKDAVNIYNVGTAIGQEVTFEFRWSPDGRCCLMKLNNESIAFADFDEKQLLARSNFPSVSTWTQQPRMLWVLPSETRFES